VTDVYLNTIASALGSTTEHNDASSLNQPLADCERIVQKTGVKSRPIVAYDEYTSHLALRATENVLLLTNADAAHVDALIVCTQTPDHLIPGVSSKVHGMLGFAQSCYAMDINQGCSGFIYGTQLVTAMIKAGTAKNALLVNADCYSRLIRPDDLTTRILFGDAATASSFSSKPGGFRLIYSRCYSDGKGYDDFIARGSAIQPDSGMESGIYMNGPAILSFALRVVPIAVNTALIENGLRSENIRMFAFHQANSFVIGKLSNKLHLQPDQVPQNCSDLGNTVSASIPMLLLEQMPNLRFGEIVMAVGFGVGLSWGVSLFEYVGTPHSD
jgi:3-oxoacyl-[acyl-carrier-protein] synthase-3